MSNAGLLGREHFAAYADPVTNSKLRKKSQMLKGVTNSVINKEDK